MRRGAGPGPAVPAADRLRPNNAKMRGAIAKVPLRLVASSPPPFPEQKLVNAQSDSATDEDSDKGPPGAAGLRHQDCQPRFAAVNAAQGPLYVEGTFLGKVVKSGAQVPHLLSVETDEVFQARKQSEAEAVQPGSQCVFCTNRNTDSS